MELSKDDLETMRMTYRVEGTYSPYKFIQVDVSGAGEGRLSYRFYGEQEKENVLLFQVDSATIKELNALHRKTDFFNLEVMDVNKDKIRVTDVGTTTLKYSFAGRERVISYGYVEDNPLSEILKVYYRLLNQYLPSRRSEKY